jgi:uncharacterized membrane protein YgcG
VRLYSAFSEETLRARKLLSDWVSEGFLTKEQHQLLKQETVSELRTTNIYLRVVFFFFTLLIVGAATALFFVVFLSHPSDPTIGVVLLFFGAVCYATAEAAVFQTRLYRYGIEEALAVCSVGFLCGGMQLALFSTYSPNPDATQSLVPAAGAVFSLWIWRRFGLSYAFLAVMIFVVFVPGYWTSSHAAQHVIVALFYAAGLAGASALRSRHRFDYLDERYSLVEALLWLGIYLAMNLQLSSLHLLQQQWWGSARTASEFPRPFYWTTWVLIWCLPPVILTRGIRQKDRFVIAAGAIAAVLTLACNKPYLGWQRHTWDPMFLGILLTGVAVFIRRWLARGPDRVRHGFTAERLSGKDKQWMNVGSTALGLLSPDSLTPSPQASSDFRFGGGRSGGGGASSNF